MSIPFLLSPPTKTTSKNLGRVYNCSDVQELIDMCNTYAPGVSYREIKLSIEQGYDSPELYLHYTSENPDYAAQHKQYLKNKLTYLEWQLDEINPTKIKEEIELIHKELNEDLQS